MRANPTVVDLFAGAGGLSLGLQRAEFKVIAAFDSWEPAVITYRMNVGEHIQRRSISSELEVPVADVLVGGPPCQGFLPLGLADRKIQGIP